MSVEATAPSGAARDDAEHAAAGVQFGRAFKGALAALRRMRGRETQVPGALSDAQYGVLFCLREHDGLAAGELAVAAELSPASATEMLEGLAAAGLVTRERSQRDRRVVLSSLTERGRRLVEERYAHHEPYFRAAMAGFTAQELRTAAAVCSALGGMFDELADEKARPGEARQP